MATPSRKYKLRFRQNVDNFDTLCNGVTPVVMFVAAALLTLKQYFGTPIICISPESYSNTLKHFVATVCFGKTDALSKEHMPTSGVHVALNPIFKFTNLLLIILAVSFYVPDNVWKYFQRKLSVSMKIVERSTAVISTQSGQERQKNIEKMAKVLEELGTAPYNRSRTVLSAAYLVVKFLYIVCIVFQLHAMTAIMGQNFNATWGIGLLMDRFLGIKSENIANFPYIAYCNTSVASPDNEVEMNHYQCFLPINVLNELLFAMLAIWMTVLLITTSIGLVAFVWKVGTYDHLKHIYEKASGRSIPEPLAYKFHEVLGNDALFMLLAVNTTSESVGKDLVKKLFENFERRIDSSTSNNENSSN
ncbi:unnamed protein product [Caenorhabditis bovis]|uniref:Innexin n=1 Tax=Caenorhabditis bovis TaxID=2654633 RepID=A0A8S1EJL4_9PELO|nr:unnamed protein product [Caenorhabditis bovis]